MSVRVEGAGLVEWRGQVAWLLDFYCRTIHPARVPRRLHFAPQRFMATMAAEDGSPEAEAEHHRMAASLRAEERAKC